MRRAHAAAALGAAMIMIFSVGIAAAEPPIERPSAVFDAIPTETPTETQTETPIITPTMSPTMTPTPTPTASPTETPTEEPTITPTVTPTPTELPNYLTLGAELENLDGVVRMSYRVDFGRYDFEGVPVNVYLAAVTSPAFSAGEPFSIDDLFASGEVRIFTSTLRSYVYNGTVNGPTFRDVIFPSVPVEGSLLLDTATSGIYRETYALAAVFINADTGEFIRTDDLPATGTGTFTPFQYHADILTRTIHLGSVWASYMTDWEVPYSEGIVAKRTFIVDPAPTSSVVLEGSYWGTYFTTNPFFVNERLITDIPGMKNSNRWAMSAGRVPPYCFLQGENLATFKSSLFLNTGHWDNYMAKGWEIYYN